MGRKINGVIQHRGKKKDLSKTVKQFLSEKHPDIQDDDMVEVFEYTSFELNNTWKQGK